MTKLIIDLSDRAIRQRISIALAVLFNKESLAKYAYFYGDHLRPYCNTNCRTAKCVKARGDK